MSDDDELIIEIIDDNNLLEEKSIDSRKTSHYMTRYEYARLVGFRTLHIMGGAPPKIDIEGMVCPQEIAKRELHQRVIPLIITRTLPNGTRERWNPNEMHIIDY